MILSILICTLEDRKQQLNILLDELKTQTGINTYFLLESADLILEGKNEQVQILIYSDNKEKSTGSKRQKLLESAKGQYVCFIDDDDEIMPYYVQEILNAAKSECDCIGICGYMTTNGINEIGWELSKDFENDTIIRHGKRFYIRKTNHIAPVKRILALQAGFPDISNGEDKGYSESLNMFLKTEHKIEDIPMYHYKYITRQKEYLT